MQKKIEQFLSRRKFLKYGSLAAGTLALTAGCSPKDKPSTATEETAVKTLMTPAARGSKMRVGYQTGDINNVTMVAFHKGYFDKVGLNVELAPYSSGGVMVPALAAGEVDITWFFPFPSLTAYARGVALEVILLDHAPQTAERLIAQENETNVSSLKGKPIGVTFGSSGHHSLLTALKQAGLTPNDVTLVNLKPSEIVPAFSAGKIDAAWTWEPGAGKLNALGGKNLATSKSVGAYAVALWAARKEFAEANPESMMKFMTAWDMAQQDYFADPAAGQKWEAERLGLPPKEFGEMVDRQGSTVILVKDQLSNQWLGEPGKAEETNLYKAYEEYALFLVEQGRIDKVLSNLAPLINSSYVAKYLQTKG